MTRRQGGRQGRIALYSDAHLARLRLVAELLDRGCTLNSIPELLAVGEKGRATSPMGPGSSRS